MTSDWMVAVLPVKGQPQKPLLGDMCFDLEVSQKEGSPGSEMWHTTWIITDICQVGIDLPRVGFVNKENWYNFFRILRF